MKIDKTAAIIRRKTLKYLNIKYKELVVINWEDLDASEQDYWTVIAKIASKIDWKNLIK